MPLPAVLYALALQRWGEPVDPETVPLLRTGAVVLIMGGLILRAWIVGRVPPGSSEASTRTMSASTLNTTGPYSVVRNPIYGTNLLIWLGIAVLAGYPAVVVVTLLVFSLGYDRVIRAEEAHLRDQFGEAYAVWAAATPRLVPRFSQYRSMTAEHSLGRMLVRESKVWVVVAGLFLLIEWGRGSGASIPAASGLIYWGLRLTPWALLMGWALELVWRAVRGGGERE